LVSNRTRKTRIFYNQKKWFSFEPNRKYPPPAQFLSEKHAITYLKDHIQQQQEKSLKEIQQVELVQKYEI
jgi:hypothetical protein